MWAFTHGYLYSGVSICSFAARVHWGCFCSLSYGAGFFRSCPLKCLQKRKPHHSLQANVERLCWKFTADLVQHENKDAPFVFTEQISGWILCCPHFLVICITGIWYAECIALSERFREMLFFLFSSVLFYSIKNYVNNIINLLSNNSIYHKHLCG